MTSPSLLICLSHTYTTLAHTKTSRNVTLPFAASRLSQPRVTAASRSHTVCTHAKAEGRVIAGRSQLKGRHFGAVDDSVPQGLTGTTLHRPSGAVTSPASSQLSRGPAEPPSMTEHPPQIPPAVVNRPIAPPHSTSTNPPPPAECPRGS